MMEEIKSSLHIDLSTYRQPADVCTIQGNYGARPIEIDLNVGNDDYDLTGLTLRLYVKKPDGCIVYMPLTPDDPVKGHIRIQPTAQMLAAAGAAQCEIEICEGDKRLTTIPFKLHIKPSLRDDDAIESSNEFSALQNALNKVGDLDGLPDRLEGMEGRIDALEEEGQNLPVATDEEVDEMLDEIYGEDDIP